MVVCMVKNDEHLDKEKFLNWARQVEKVTKLQNCESTLIWNLSDNKYEDMEAVEVAVVPRISGGEGVADLKSLIKDVDWNRGVVSISDQSFVFKCDSDQELQKAQEFINKRKKHGSPVIQKHMEYRDIIGTFIVIFVAGKLT